MTYIVSSVALNSTPTNQASCAVAVGLLLLRTFLGRCSSLCKFVTGLVSFVSIFSSLSLHDAFTTVVLCGTIITGCAVGNCKTRPSQNPHPLTDHQRICHMWLRRRSLQLCHIWCKSVHGGFWANGWNITKDRPEIFIYLFIYLYNFFSGTHLQVRPIDGFSRLMAQTTWTRTMVRILGFCWYCSPFWGWNPPPKKPQFCGRE